MHTIYRGQATFSRENAAASICTNAIAEPSSRESIIVSYNQFWRDGGDTVLATGQTSLIIDPATGLAPIRAGAEAERDYNFAHVMDSYEHMTVWDRCFTRVSEDIIIWELTITDPDIYTQPFTISMPLTRDDGYVMYEYACHEGNHAVANILRGGRLAD